MRNICLLVAIAVAAGCSTAPQPVGRTSEAEAKLQKLIAGKVAGEPQSCLSSRSADMTVIDDGLVAYRLGARVYVNDFRGGRCARLGSGHYALLTRSVGTGSLCSGDVAQVVDTSTGMTVGSCVLGEFTPYSAPGL